MSDLLTSTYLDRGVPDMHFGFLGLAAKVQSLQVYPRSCRVFAFRDRRGAVFKITRWHRLEVAPLHVPAAVDVVNHGELRQLRRMRNDSDLPDDFTSH